MRKCTFCGSIIEDGQTFCGECGSPVQQEPTGFCGECGSPLEPGVAFCANCGASVVQKQNGPSTNNQSVNNNYYAHQKPVHSNGYQKKSKNNKLIIGIVVAVILLVIAVGGIYWFMTVQRQDKIEKAYKEVTEYVENESIDLTDANESILWTAYKDRNSMNWGILEDSYKAIEGMLDKAKTIKDGKTKLDSYKTELESLKASANTNGVMDLCSYDIELCETDISELETAIKDNDVAKITDEEDSIKKSLENIRNRVGDNATLAKDNALEVYNQYKARFDSIVKTAEDKNVVKKQNIKKYKKEASDALSAYKKAVDANDLSNLSVLKQNVEYSLEDFEEEVSNEEEVEEIEEYVLYYSDSSVISDTYFEDMYLTDEERLCLCVLAKNEIYARHGAKFQTDSLQEYFNSTSWYDNKKIATDKLYGEMNSYEKENIDVLNELIEFYKEYVPGATGKADYYSYENYVYVVNRLYDND